MSAFNERNKKKGFSAVEITVASAIFALIVIGLWDLLYFRSKSEIEIESSIDLHKNARHSVAKMVKELQEGREVLSPINTTAAVAHIMFVNNSDDVVVYFYRPGQKKLFRALIDDSTGKTTAEAELVDGVEDCSFITLGKSNRLVELYLKLGIYTAAGGNSRRLKTYDISTHVYLRNL